MVRAVKYLQIIHEEQLVTHAARMGEHFLAGLERLGERHGEVSNVRGRGLFTAFSLPTGELRDRLRQRCWDRGLATLASWPTSIRFRPCLNVAPSEVDLALEILDDCLTTL